MSLSHVSLFAGVGGADLGMESAGIDTILACEIDKHARAVLGHRFPRATLHDDVRTLTGDDLRRAGAVPERTIISGGFPCQPFSVAGRRRGMGGEDERGDLYWQISRILSEFPARWVVLENVPGLLSIDGGRTFGTILGDLADLGYGVAYRVLDAQFFGVPQRRRRVFIVGCLGDDRRPVEVLLEPEGRAGDPAPGLTPGAGAATGLGGGVDGSGVVGSLTSARGGGRQRRPGPPPHPVAATLNSGGNDGGFRTEPGEHLVVVREGEACGDGPGRRDMARGGGVSDVERLR